jgi:hypothetical protein
MEIKTEVKKKVEKLVDEDIQNKHSHGTYKRGNIVQRQKVQQTTCTFRTRNICG